MLEAGIRFMISPFFLVISFLFGRLEKYINKKRIRLNKYYVCTITNEEVILDNKPKWVYFNLDGERFMGMRQDAIDKIRKMNLDRNISTTTITLQRRLENEGAIGNETNRAVNNYRVDAYYLTLCNMNNWKKGLIRKRFRQISEGRPKKYVFR